MGIELRLFHDGDWGEGTAVPRGTTDKEGRFILSTFHFQDGAPAGHYFVQAEWPAFKNGRKIVPDRFGGKYSDPDASGLELDIQKGKNELPVLNLSMDPTKLKSGLNVNSGGKKKGQKL